MKVFKSSLIVAALFLSQTGWSLDASPNVFVSQPPVVPHGVATFTLDASGAAQCSLGNTGPCKCSNGQCVFTVPAQVTTIYVSEAGGGGSGDFARVGPPGSGGGGGAGAAFLKVPLTVAPGQALPVVVGAGGVPNLDWANPSSNPGGASSVGGFVAPGGQGGNPAGGAPGGPGGQPGLPGGGCFGTPGCGGAGGGGLFGSGGEITRNASGFGAGAGGGGRYVDWKHKMYASPPGSGSAGFVEIDF